MRKGDHLEDPGLDGRIILNRIFKECNDDLVWLGTGTSDGLLRMR